MQLRNYKYYIHYGMVKPILYKRKAVNCLKYDRMLDKKKALITGAGQLGEACSLLFAEHGAAVAIVDIDKSKGKELSGRLQEINPDCQFYHADLRLEKDIEIFCGKYLNDYGAPDIWCNAAGVFYPAFIDEICVNDLCEMVAVNLTAPYLIMQKIAPAMIKNGGGSIIQICSEFALTAHHGVSGFAASKGGQHAMTNAFAMDFAPYGIRANCILPGQNFTSMGDRTIELIGKEAAEEFFTKSQYYPRRGQPDDVAELALFLASDMSKHITGEAILINGGQHVIPHKNIFAGVIG